MLLNFLGVHEERDSIRYISSPQLLTFDPALGCDQSHALCKFGRGLKKEKERRSCESMISFLNLRERKEKKEMFLKKKKVDGHFFLNLTIRLFVRMSQHTIRNEFAPRSLPVCFGLCVRIKCIWKLYDCNTLFVRS